MTLNITVDENWNAPLYKQIAGSIMKDIASGKIPAGYKLPTVRELADEMGISKGTIKHAYEHLEQMGVIEMTQGKGTFVLEAENASSSRKERAMKAIDDLFEELEELGFTPREMEIYLKLKLHGLEEKYEMVKAAVIDCNPETIRLIEDQLAEIEYVETASFSLNQIGTVANKLNEEYDLVLTTSTHYPEVEPLIRNRKAVAMMAMRPTNETIIHMARLEKDAKVGVVCASDNFAGVVRRSCSGIGPWSEGIPSCLFGSGSNLETFLKAKTAIILPKGYEAFASVSEKKLIREFLENGGESILYDYIIDSGSLLYVKGLIQQIMNQKRSA